MAGVAVVTGASRGGGKAIALELGAAGWTVFVTGRTTRTSPSPEGMPGTIEDTADEVTSAGGRGIPIRCDHTKIDEIDALADRVRSETQQLSLLVNNAWGGYEGHRVAEFSRPFWEQPLSAWDRMFTAGVRAALWTSSRLSPLMIARRAGLVVQTVAWLRGVYLGNLYYDAAKAALIRLTEGMAGELRPYGVAAVAVAPGFMRTERVMAAHRASPFDLSGTESPTYLGRAVRALASDPRILEKSGKLVYVGDLAKEYKLTDVDGTQPPPSGTVGT